MIGRSLTGWSRNFVSGSLACENRDVRRASVAGREMESLTACPSCGSAQGGPSMAIRERLIDGDKTFTVLMCEGCGLHRTNPRPTRQESGRYYPQHYGPYQPSGSTVSPWISRGLKEIGRAHA